MASANPLLDPSHPYFDRDMYERVYGAPYSPSGIAAYASAPAEVSPSSYLDDSGRVTYNPDFFTAQQATVDRISNGEGFGSFTPTREENIVAMVPESTWRALGWTGDAPTKIEVEGHGEYATPVTKLNPEFKEWKDAQGLNVASTQSGGGGLSGTNTSFFVTDKQGEVVAPGYSQSNMGMGTMLTPIAMAVGANYLLPAAGAAGSSAEYLAAADAAGGLVPEFGTHAAYEAGLAGAGGAGAGIGAYSPEAMQSAYVGAAEPVAASPIAYPSGPEAMQSAYAGAGEPVAEASSLGAATEPVSSLAPAEAAPAAAAAAYPAGPEALQTAYAGAAPAPWYEKLGQWALSNPMQALQLASVVGGGIKNLLGGGSDDPASAPGINQSGFTATPPPALNRTVVAPPAGHRPGFDPEWNYFKPGA